MQTYRFKTGCTFILALITITAARPAAFAQQKQEIRKTIIITDGDTIINGKNLKNLSKSDRAALRKELQAMEKNRSMRRAGKQKNEEIIIKNGNQAPKILRWSDEDEISMNDYPWVLSDSLVTFMKDSLPRQLRFNMEHMDSNMHQKMMELHRRIGSMPPMMGRAYPRMLSPKEGINLYNRIPSGGKNLQSFNYVNTDKDGITTHLNIRLTDVPEELSKKISHDTKVLEVTDLVISPNFSSGKLNLIFQTAARGSISVKILDSDLKALFTDQPANFSGNYYKQVSLPKNGIYYIHISQNGKSFIKKMVKE
ncbi:MAG TPA: hypothetical protein VEV16_01540 [Daejeonella sp.]|nr:hypothetical protein [Daejeonella sp.]